MRPAFTGCETDEKSGFLGAEASRDDNKEKAPFGMAEAMP